MSRLKLGILYQRKSLIPLEKQNSRKEDMLQYLDLRQGDMNLARMKVEL